MKTRGHFIDNHINFRRLFAEAIRDSIVDNFDRSLIRPGYFIGRLGTGKMLVEARIYERDPDDGDTPVGEILGEHCDPVLVWTLRDRQPLVAPEGYTVEGWYRYRADLAAWSKENAPEEPLARPYRKVDLTKIPPIPPDTRFSIGGNKPPEPLTDEPAGRAVEDWRVADLVEAEDQIVLDLIANTNKWLEDYPVIETEEVGREATDALEQLQKVDERYEEEFKKAKAPHEEKLKQICEVWRPRIDRIKLCIKALRPRQRAWIKLSEDLRKAEEAAAKRAVEEAQRRANQLAEQAQAGGPSAVTNMIIAAEAAQAAERARQAAATVPARAQVRGNLGGRTHSLRTVWKSTIVEQDLLYQHFRDDRDVVTLLQQKANAAARSGIRNPDLPGCWIYSEEI